MAKIEIAIKEYVELLIAQEELARLECGGVDNWKWYGESLRGDDGEESMEDFRERLYKEYGVE